MTLSVGAPSRTPRQIAVAPQKGLRLIGDLYFTVCRWCDQPIVKPNGAPNLRRNWHPGCVTEYLIRRSPGYLRQVVFRRDRGLCAGCGFWIAIPATKEQAAVVDYTLRWRVGSQWYVGLGWAADHIIPLVEGGPLDLANVQTLCTACHKAKTAREAKERAFKRRLPASLPSLYCDLTLNL